MKPRIYLFLYLGTALLYHKRAVSLYWIFIHDSVSERGINIHEPWDRSFMNLRRIGKLHFKSTLFFQHVQDGVQDDRVLFAMTIIDDDASFEEWMID